jgi:murein DD-endopeptidase MepM/ murein hydrolase activator NlpD
LFSCTFEQAHGMKEFPLIVAAALALLAGPAAPDPAGQSSEQVRAEERVLGARHQDLPVTREVAADGVVVGLLDLAFVRAGVSTGLAAELRRAFAVALDLERDVQSGDAFHVRYAETRTPRGAVITRRLLWAEFRTKIKGSVAVHRFPGRDHREQLWLANGQAARPPAMRMPLDSVLVSSGFGVRPDPFDKQRAQSVKAASMVSLKRAVPTKPPGVRDADAPLAIDTPLSVLLGLDERSVGALKKAARVPCASCLHEGIDLVAPAGTPIHAAADGVVSGAAPNGRYGNWVRIEHAGGLATVYGHLEKFAPGIELGRKVTQGDVIGLVGSTGHSTGAHLHFELRTDGKPVDPLRSPLFKVERLQGQELERFRRQVVRSLEQRAPRARLL